MNLDFYRGKTVLVTGHTGFQGAWLSEVLLRLGARVVGLSLPPHTTPNAYEILSLGGRVEHHAADIRDAAAVREIVRNAAPDIVVHLAAQAIVRAGYDDALSTHATNVLGTAHVLEALRDLPTLCAAVIVTTDKVYENREDGRLFAEEDALGGRDPYSASKAAADVITRSYAASFFSARPGHRYSGAHIGVARSGNVIGGGDWGSDRLIPDVVRSVYERRAPVVIRHPLSVRPWQHVLEPLHGYLRLAERLSDPVLGAGASDAWNFGPPDSDQGKTVETVVMRMIEGLGAGEYTVAQGDEKPEMAMLGISSAKANRALGWKSVLTFDEAIRWTAEWYRTWYREPERIRDVTNRQIERFLDRIG